MRGIFLGPFTLFLFFAVACASVGCDRESTATGPSPAWTLVSPAWTLEGVVISVTPSDRTFSFIGTYGDGMGLVDSSTARFEGDVRDYDTLVGEYRRGMTLKATLHFSSQPMTPYRPTTVTVSSEPSSRVTFKHNVDVGFFTGPSPRIILGAAHAP